MTKEQKNTLNNFANFGEKSDFIRYVILEHFGGIYCDTDFECIKPFDALVSTCTFFAGTVFNKSPEICNALIGSIPHHPIMISLIEKIQANRKPPKKNIDVYDTFNRTGPYFFTKHFFDSKELITATDIIFPTHYFYPFPNFLQSANMSLKFIHESFLHDTSYAIHYWEISWVKKTCFYYIKYVIKKIIFYDKWKKYIRGKK